MMRLHSSVLVLVVSALLLVYLWSQFGPDPGPPPWGQVFWESDAEAAKAPYVYRFSSFHDHYPGVMLSDQSVPCLPQGSATVVSGGRLGNLILEYVSLWTAARLYNLSAFVPAQLHYRLEEVFEPLGLPVEGAFLSRSGCTKESWTLAAESLLKIDQRQNPLSEIVAKARDLHVPIVFEMCVILAETIVALAAEVRRHFRYRPELREYAQDKLRDIRNTVLSVEPTVKDVVFAGVHVRRTDYHDQLRYLYNSDRPADEGYYGRAALWLRSKVVAPGSELVLVIASDEPEWVRDVLVPHLRLLGLRHSYLAGNGRLTAPERDLAMLSACNHSVLAYGTYGIWTALEAGGRAVVYHLDHGDAVSPAMEFAQHMPGWVAIK